MTVRRLARGLTWTIVALLVVYHAVAAWYFSGEILDNGFRPDTTVAEDPPGGYRIQQVSYSSGLGEMEAWYLPSFRSTWVIHVHGKDRTPGEALHLFAPLQDEGYPQLAITYRNDAGQPVDPSGIFSYGLTESDDIAGAVDYAEANGAQSVVLSGFGGGASLILAHLYRTNTVSVIGVILDSPIVDASDTADHWLATWRLPLLSLPTPPTVAPLARFAASMREEINWRRIDYVDRAAADLAVPVLVLHGTADQVAPITQSIALAASAPDLVRLVQFDGEGHVGLHEADSEKYLDEVLSFLSRIG